MLILGFVEFDPTRTFQHVRFSAACGAVAIYEYALCRHVRRLPLTRFAMSATRSPSVTPRPERLLWLR